MAAAAQRGLLRARIAAAGQSSAFVTVRDGPTVRSVTPRAEGAARSDGGGRSTLEYRRL